MPDSEVPDNKRAKLRIAYFTSCYPRASDTFIRTEVHTLRKMGHEVATFSVRRPPKEQLVSADVLQEYHGTVYLLSKPLALFYVFFFNWLRHPANMLKAFVLAVKTAPPGLKRKVWQLAYFIEASLLARLLRKRKIGHLHNHIGEASATVAMLAAAISGIPYSLTIHGPGIFYDPVRWHLGEKIHRAAFTKCISNFCKSQCMAFSSTLDWKKLHVIHCSVDAAFYHNGRTKEAERTKLVAIGRLEAFKGFDLLLESAEELKKEGFDFELAIIGDGPDREKLQDKIRHLHLEEHVFLKGWQSQEKVREEIEASRALVMSSFAEGLPLVLIEAMMLGRPAVAPRIAGIPELVDDGANGLLYPAGSLEELTQKIKAILRMQQADVDAMGKRATEAASGQFNPAIEVKKLADLIAKNYLDL